MLNPIRAVSLGLRNILNVKGRASRAEYWWFTLFAFGYLMVSTSLLAFAYDHFAPFPDTPPEVIMGAQDTLSLGDDTVFKPERPSSIIMGYIMVPLFSAMSLVVFISLFTLTIRRLHDSGSRGWWMLLIFGHIAGLWLLGMLIRKSDELPNRFGNPRGFM